VCSLPTAVWRLGPGTCYVKNKARLTGQTAPGGDFPATGRPPGAEALAVAGAGPRGRRDLLVLANDPPVTVTASRQRAQDGHTIFGMSRLRSAGSSAQSLAAVAVAPRPSTSSRNPCAW